MGDKAQDWFEKLIPLVLIVLGGAWICVAETKGWGDLKSYAIGVGGAGLALLTQQARASLHTEKGGTVNITAPPPPAPPLENGGLLATPPSAQ